MSHGMDPDDRLDGDLLFRVRGSELCLPDRERDFSARGAGVGDRDILRDRHGAWRGRRPRAVWLSIGSGVIVAVAVGYAIAAVLMLIAAAAELKFGIDAEQRSLESIAQPLSSA
jgi:hypothetical protein